jgi:hypothetical protein
VAAQQGLAEAQSRVAKARQELADGIQNGLLIKVRTALVEEALIKAVNREDKLSRRYRDRDLAKFESSRRYRER